jgi:hypothetical protein
MLAVIKRRSANSLPQSSSQTSLLFSKMAPYDRPSAQELARLRLQVDLYIAGKKRQFEFVKDSVIEEKVTDINGHTHVTKGYNRVQLKHGRSRRNSNREGFWDSFYGLFKKRRLS